MDCSTARDCLVRDEPGADLSEHVKGCPACATFSHRLELAREALRDSGAPLEADPGFALRVVERLPRPAEVLGWAALRALPAAVAMALALAWLGLTQIPSPAALLSSEPSPDLLFTYTALAPLAQEGAP